MTHATLRSIAVSPTNVPWLAAFGLLGLFLCGGWALTAVDPEDTRLAVIGAVILGGGVIAWLVFIIKQALAEVQQECDLLHLEVETLRSQRSRFISNTSHELRTPLATLIQRMHLMRKQPTKGEEHLQVMETMTDYMQRLLNEMMEVSHYEQGKVSLEQREISLQAVVEDVADNYTKKAAKRNVVLDYQPLPVEYHVLADRKRLTQVVANLVSWSLNHTPAQGCIKVRIFRQDAQTAMVEVSDDAAPIPPETLAQLFQPFSSASQGGSSETVLGLSLSQYIISLHGGKIYAESNVGRGNRVFFALPLLAHETPAFA